MNTKKMKQLQNNFTTPEQSKRLLELGVPSDSADCYLQYDNFQCFYRRALFEEGYEKSSQMHMHKNDLPCWSVGRLIEIYEICTGRKWRQSDTDIPLIEKITYDIEVDVQDFSKLED